MLPSSATALLPTVASSAALPHHGETVTHQSICQSGSGCAYERLPRLLASRGDLPARQRLIGSPLPETISTLSVLPTATRLAAFDRPQLITTVGTAQHGAPVRLEGTPAPVNTTPWVKRSQHLPLHCLTGHEKTKRGRNHGSWSVCSQSLIRNGVPIAPPTNFQYGYHGARPNCHHHSSEQLPRRCQRLPVGLCDRSCQSRGEPTLGARRRVLPRARLTKVQDQQGANDCCVSTIELPTTIQLQLLAARQ